MTKQDDLERCLVCGEGIDPNGEYACIWGDGASVRGFAHLKCAETLGDDITAEIMEPTPQTDDNMTTRSVLVAEMIEKILAGENRAVQGAVVMQMFATLIAGHHPSIRRATMQTIIDAATGLVPVEVERMIDAKVAPEDWRDPLWTKPQGTA